MNKERRKQIELLLVDLKVLIGKVEILRNEEQAAFDNLSEGLLASERAVSMETAISRLDDAISSLDDTEDALIEACT